VEFAAAYLRVEQARFGERLRVEFQVDPSTDTIQVPAMSIQPLIENAVKHGVSAVEGRGTVGLRARLLEGWLSIEVFDNGRAFRRLFALRACLANTGGYGHAQRGGAPAGLLWRFGAIVLENGADGTHVFMRIPHPPPDLTGETRVIRY